ncbi:CBS domain-containing protein [Anaerolineales bacterium HSG25]|nr:CBS domain-containing protein [Anaerolineales bacterium HSG25]
METVKQLLDKKGREVWSILGDTLMYDALKMMDDKNVGGLLVQEGDTYTGFLSERDYARGVVRESDITLNSQVKEVMTTRVLYVTPTHKIEECMALMIEKRVRHLPVKDGDIFVGVVSIGDVVKTVISQQKFMIEQLENYITGS